MVSIHIQVFNLHDDLWMNITEIHINIHKQTHTHIHNKPLTTSKIAAAYGCFLCISSFETYMLLAKIGLQYTVVSNVNIGSTDLQKRIIGFSDCYDCVISWPFIELCHYTVSQLKTYHIYLYSQSLSKNTYTLSFSPSNYLTSYLS